MDVSNTEQAKRWVKIQYVYVESVGIRGIEGEGPTVVLQQSVVRITINLIESLFRLLYNGLRPLLEASAGSKNQLEALRKSIETCLQRYQALQEEIKKTDTSR